MPLSLQHLFETINQVSDESELRSQVTPMLREHFAAQRSGVFFFEQLWKDPRFQKILNIALSIKHNPVARYIAERHTPIHEGAVTSAKAWAIFCPRPDHRHVMAGPILDRGQLVGAVGCTRDQSMPSFNAQDLKDLGAVCLHLSVWTTALQSRQITTVVERDYKLYTDRLTPREQQIANLVAMGRTNAEIGTELWITENSVKQALKRMFRKLKVSSRTEMTAQIITTHPPVTGIKLP